MAVENPFYVLIASGGDVLVARIVHSRVYETIKETWRTKRGDPQGAGQKLNGGSNSGIPHVDVKY